VISRQTLGRKLARLATDVTVRRPRLWRLFRPLLRKQFDLIAPGWDAMRLEDTFAPYEAALQAIERPPAHILDLGTGTGAGAFILAGRFPQAEIVGVDLSDGMLDYARRNVPEEARARVKFLRADASMLPFADESFDLVTHANMIPFFDEVARVLAPSGQVLFAFSGGAGTPIYVPTARLRSELARRGFTDFAEFNAGRGNALLARKGNRA
jgi:SAM-dependent methyltransferase